MQSRRATRTQRQRTLKPSTGRLPGATDICVSRSITQSNFSGKKRAGYTKQLLWQEEGRVRHARAVGERQDVERTACDAACVQAKQSSRFKEAGIEVYRAAWMSSGTQCVRCACRARGVLDLALLHRNSLPGRESRAAAHSTCRNEHQSEPFSTITSE